MANVAPAHPGTITFVDGMTKKVTHTRTAEEVPESVRFAESDGQLVPVVRIEAYEEGDRRIIREFGEDGTELRSTVQIRNAPQ